MRSLRWRLICYVGLAMGLLLLTVGISLFGLIRQALTAQFDRGLVAETQVLAMEVEIIKGEARVDVKDGSLPYFEQVRGREFFELWDEHGQVLQRSNSLRGADLTTSFAGQQVYVPYTVVLPDKRLARQVMIDGIAAPEEDAAAQRPPVRFVLVVARASSDLDIRMGQITSLMLLVGPLTIAATLIVAAMAIRAGLRPVDVLAKRMSGLRLDRLTDQVNVPGAPLELRPMIDGLNGLLVRLDATLARERSLSADVAHELRNPLQGLRGKLEVSLSRPRSTGEYTHTLNACLAITTQIQSLVESLLTLTRLEAGQLVAQPSRVELLPLIREVWDRFARAADDLGLAVDVGGDDLTVVTDRAWLAQIVQNLVENAVSYTNERGTIQVRVAREGSGAVLEVRNTGSRVASQDAARVFDRFWRADGARAGTGEHCGLGLALVQRIAAMLGHEIDVASEMGGWFTVRLRFGTADAAQPERAAAVGGK